MPVFTADHECPLMYEHEMPPVDTQWRCPECDKLWEVVLIWKNRFWQPAMFDGKEEESYGAETG